MEFYCITEPAHADGYPGRACDIAPPDVGLPGVRCDACGQTWADFSQRIRIDLPAGHPVYLRRRTPVPVPESDSLIADVRSTLHLRSDVVIRPGADIGIVRLFCKRADVGTFEWPKVHTVIITGYGRSALEAAALTGWHVEQVVVRAEPDIAGLLPALYELVVDGLAGAALTTPPTVRISRCSACGREEFSAASSDGHVCDETGQGPMPPLAPARLDVNPAAWDGSDFFRFDPPYNGYIFVTSRCKGAIETAGLTNVAFQSVSELLRRRKRGVYYWPSS